MAAAPWHAAAMADQMTRLVVDSPSLFYRAFFALPKSIKGPDGNSVNAVRGYLDMVSRVLVDRRPRAVANGPTTRRSCPARSPCCWRCWTRPACRWPRRPATRPTT
jgi:5'-3' exonuclease